MGISDYEDNLPELPPEAVANANVHPIEINDAWLAEADEKVASAAMRAWFYARYCDPANDTPYNSREGGYLFIHGGPYDPSDVLLTRFASIVDHKVIDELVDDLYMEVGSEWAPVGSAREEEDYDPSFEFSGEGPDGALSILTDRIEQLRMVLTLSGDAAARDLAQKLVYSALIGAMESFLWESVDWHIERDPAALRAIVSKVPAFRDEKIPLADIFVRMDTLKQHVKGHLQNTVWHRWDKVSPLLLALDVKLPRAAEVNAAIKKRHDIVHRSGFDIDGKPLTISALEIDSLAAAVLDLCRDIHRQLGLFGFEDETADSKA